MNNNTNKTAFWADELPDEIKTVIKKTKISALIRTFEKYNDPFCIALLCDELTINPDEAEALAQIRKLAYDKSFKKGFAYEQLKILVLEIWDALKGTDTNIAVRQRISAECKITPEVVRKIIQHK